MKTITRQYLNQTLSTLFSANDTLTLASLTTEPKSELEEEVREVETKMRDLQNSISKLLSFNGKAY